MFWFIKANELKSYKNLNLLNQTTSQLKMNNKEFETMSREEKVNLAKQISDLATESGFSLKVQLYSENVCQLFGEKP